MRIVQLLVCVALVFGPVMGRAASLPGDTPVSADPAHQLPLTPALFQKMTGKHLSFLQRIEWKLLQKKLKKVAREHPELTEKQIKQGRASMIMGIASFVFLFIPGVALLSIPLAILGLIFGLKSIKGNSNAKGVVGVVFSGVTLFLILLAIILVAAIIGSFV